MGGDARSTVTRLAWAVGCAPACPRAVNRHRGGAEQMASGDEVRAMRRAVTLAAGALGRTSPNPTVGCVILDSTGVVVGEGWHDAYGGPHAESNAPSQAAHRADGRTALVTLEPCNHPGRTGPCSEALLGAGIRRVVYAGPDPTPEA